MYRLFKIMFAIFVLSFAVLSMPLICKAYTAPDNNEYEYKYKVMNGPILMDMYTNKECCLCTQSGYEQDGNYRLYTVNDDKTRLFSVEFSPNNHYFRCNVSWYGSGVEVPFDFGYTSTTTIYDSACLSKNYTGYSELQTFSTYQAAFEYLITPRVDWDHIMYDPSIPTPIFSVYYNDDSTTMPRFNADIELKNASEDLYAYVTMDNATPISYGIAYDGNMYNIAYHKFATREIVSRESLTISDTLSMQLLSGMLASAWRSDINTISDSDIEVSAISDGAYFGESSPSFITWKTQLLNFRKIALFYGNSNTISVQYFRVVDGQAYAGEIKSWNNKNGGVFTVTIPKYYIPDNPANGFEVVTIDRPLETENPMTTIPDNQYGYQTGIEVNINVGSVVPNRPDYPTIASYNLDNLLVKTIDQGKNIGGFLSGVSGFAQAALAFIPDYVWQLVAFGLGLSIVVMFLKIL